MPASKGVPVDREQKSGWLIAMLAALVVAVMAFGMIYTSRMVAASERRDCDTLRSDIEAYQAEPPGSRVGWNQWNSKTQRYREIGCEPAVPNLPPAPPPPPGN